jgi:hypothetical protein
MGFPWWAVAERLFLSNPKYAIGYQGRIGGFVSGLLLKDIVSGFDRFSVKRIELRHKADRADQVKIIGLTYFSRG